MTRIVTLEVLDWRYHGYRSGVIEVKVKVPMKEGIESTEWYVPNMHEVKRKYRCHGDNYDTLVGKRLRIPELEMQAEKAGYKMVKRRRWKG